VIRQVYFDYPLKILIFQYDGLKSVAASDKRSTLRSFMVGAMMYLDGVQILKNLMNGTHQASQISTVLQSAGRLDHS
jgi:hypothetical protein